MAFTARLRVGGTESLSRAMLAAVRPSFRATCDAAGQQAIENIVAYANAEHGNNPRSGQRSTPLASPSNYRHQVTTIRRGVALEVFVVNGDANFMKKFHALNTGRKGRRAMRQPSPSVFAFPGRAGGPTTVKLSKKGNVVVRRIAGDSGGAVSGFYDNAVRDALEAYNLTS